MRQRVFHLGGTAVSKACVVTAVLNSVIATGHGQTPLRTEQPPVDITERALHYGPFDIRPSLRAGVMYDDNIFITSTDEESDVEFATRVMEEMADVSTETISQISQTVAKIGKLQEASVIAGN